MGEIRILKNIKEAATALKIQNFKSFTQIIQNNIKYGFI